jgi:FdhD protein
MVQKAAMIGAPVLIAMSAPTALAIRTAESAGITLIAQARGDSFEIFTHVKRILRSGRDEHAPIQRQTLPLGA